MPYQGSIERNTAVLYTLRNTDSLVVYPPSHIAFIPRLVAFGPTIKTRSLSGLGKSLITRSTMPCAADAIYDTGSTFCLKLIGNDGSPQHAIVGMSFLLCNTDSSLCVGHGAIHLGVLSSVFLDSCVWMRSNDTCYGRVGPCLRRLFPLEALYITQTTACGG